MKLNKSEELYTLTGISENTIIISINDENGVRFSIGMGYENAEILADDLLHYATIIRKRIARNVKDLEETCDE